MPTSTGSGMTGDGPSRARAPFESIETETLSRRISRRLIGDIVRGEFKPGDTVVVDEGPDGNVKFTKGERAERVVH